MVEEGGLGRALLVLGYEINPLELNPFGVNPFCENPFWIGEF